MTIYSIPDAHITVGSMKALFLSCDDEMDPRVPFPEDIFFHGGKKDEAPLPGGSVEMLFGQLHSGPLMLFRIGCPAPHITRPGTEWVLSGTARGRWRNLRNTDFRAVEFFKVVNPTIAREQLATFTTPVNEFNDFMSLAEWFDTLPDDPQLHAAMGTYYQLYVPRLEREVFPDLLQEDPALRSATRSYQEYRERLKHYVTQTVLEKYPVLWTFGGLLVSADTFVLIRDLIDPAFIGHQEFQV